MSDPETPRRLFRNARREALVVLAVWGLALLWVLGYCYLRGYQHAEDSLVVRLGLAEPRQPDEFEALAGFPEWVLFGIVLPWLACSAFTVWFGVFGMSDDDLGADKEEEGHGPGH
jgi:hypothetical protein